MRNLFNITEIVIYGYGINAMFTGNINLMFGALGVGLAVCLVKNMTTRKVRILL